MNKALWVWQEATYVALQPKLPQYIATRMPIRSVLEVPAAWRILLENGFQVLKL